MKTTSILLSGAALGAAFLLVAPRDGQAFTTMGTSLSLAQRDARIFNNFSKPQTNNNTTIHPNWPGYDGAELAVWKGCQEWQSSLFGDGNGDPSQPGGVGSGGANFDVSWQGNATDIGGINSNIHSQISGGSGGVLAYTEGFPFSSGWRIRYYEVWDWRDGPGAEGGLDLQGVACHEYGHALGLNHTTVAGSTMTAFVSGSGYADRSIGPDDIAGVKFVYGVASPTKPVIDTVSVAGSQVTLSGSNFSASNNEVWFTQAGQGGFGQPVKVTGVTSNGTDITVAIPANGGPGGILVRNSGTGFANLSNSMPFDPGSGSLCDVQVYCTGKVSSSGLAASAGFVGSPSWTLQNFSLSCFNGGVPNTNGIHFWSNVGSASTPLFNGTLCLQPPTIRGPIHQYDGFGFVNVPITIDLVDIGSKRWYQFWFRDTAHPDGTGVGLSDGVEVTFCL